MAMIRGIEDGKDEPKEEPKEEPKKESTPILEEAKKINTEKKELLEREEKLQERKEKFAAEELTGGRAEAGGDVNEEKESDEEYANKFMKGEVNPMKDDDISIN